MVTMRDAWSKAGRHDRAMRRAISKNEGHPITIHLTYFWTSFIIPVRPPWPSAVAVKAEAHCREGMREGNYKGKGTLCPLSLMLMHFAKARS